MRLVYSAILACVLLGCSGMLPALQAASMGAQWLGAVLDVAEGGERAYRDRHPNRGEEQEAAAALRRARAALEAYNAALAAGEAATARDVEATRAELLRAYAALRALYADTGILTATPPPGGAETDAPMPAKLHLPTEADVDARL